jgi:hypothetical protein
LIAHSAFTYNVTSQLQLRHSVFPRKSVSTM